MPLGRKKSSSNTTKHGGGGYLAKIGIDLETDMESTSQTECGEANKDDVFEHVTKNNKLPSKKETENLGDEKIVSLNVGDILSVKGGKNFPHWPAKILNIHENGKDALVEFYETKNWSLINLEEWCSFDQNLDKYREEGIKSVHKDNFLKAITQAEMDIKDKSSNSRGPVKVEKNLEQINSRLQSIETILSSQAEKNTAEYTSWANVVGKNTNAIRVTTSRSVNAKEVIVHKMEEKPEERLEEWAGRLVTATRVKANLTEVKRIGKSNENKNRPIMISFQNAQQKDDFIANLRFIKGNEEFNFIRVTENFSYEERKILRSKIEEARSLNENETDQTKWHKVFGSPKTSLEIRVVKKRTKNSSHDD